MNWLCVNRGFHVVTGMGHGTSAGTMLVAQHCRDCGAKLVTEDSHLDGYAMGGKLAQKLHGTTDGAVWAAEYRQRYGGDQYILTTWFANAIETGRMAGRAECPDWPNAGRDGGLYFGSQGDNEPP